MNWRTGLWSVSLAWGIIAASMNRATVSMRGFGRSTPTRDRWPVKASPVRPAGTKLARKAAKGKVGLR